jgi:dienelactone hydrolase
MINVAITLVVAGAMLLETTPLRAEPSARSEVTPETIRVQLPAGAGDVDVYWPQTARKEPMVIVVHGFLRSRRNMSGWGRHLANEGMVAVVPDLPTQADHARNGRYISELRAHLLDDESFKQRIDAGRIGLLGFSAGGLSSLLSAADSPEVGVWVGLDPVDQGGLGVKAAAMVKSRAVVLTAEPSSCNAHGSARDLVAALVHSEHFGIAGAVHADAEWPTSWPAELVCGRSTDEKRAQFRELATTALQNAFALRK